jgi:hypothetical protein
MGGGLSAGFFRSNVNGGRNHFYVGVNCSFTPCLHEEVRISLSQMFVTQRNERAGMDYTLAVQKLIADPLKGRTPAQVRALFSTELADRALRHEAPDFLIQKYARDYDVDQADARALFEETKRFLVAGVLTDQSLAPSLQVDQMWHSFILFTKDYHDFCDSLGGYIHHRPIPQGDGAQPPLEPTIEIMTAAFGDVPARFWPQELGSYGIMDCKKGA